MSDDGERTDATLNELLRASAPARTRITPVIEDELARMTVAAGDEMTTAGRPRHTERLAGLTVALALLLGGAGVATAATLGDWPWWAENPDGTYFYTSPTGDWCEVRIGKIESPDPAVEAIIRDMQGHGVVLNDDDIASAFEAEKQLHQAYEADQRAQGNEPYVQPDTVLYEIAIYRVIQKYVDGRLAAEGVDLREMSNGAFELGTSGEIKCSAAPSE